MQSGAEPWLVLIAATGRELMDLKLRVVVWPDVGLILGLEFGVLVALAVAMAFCRQ